MFHQANKFGLCPFEPVTLGDVEGYFVQITYSLKRDLVTRALSP